MGKRTSIGSASGAPAHRNSPNRPSAAAAGKKRSSLGTGAAAKPAPKLAAVAAAAAEIDSQDEDEESDDDDLLEFGDEASDSEDDDDEGSDGDESEDVSPEALERMMKVSQRLLPQKATLHLERNRKSPDLLLLVSRSCSETSIRRSSAF